MDETKRGQAQHGKRFYRDMSAARRQCRQPQLVNAEHIEAQLGAYFAKTALPSDWQAQILARFAANTDAPRVEAQRRALVNELARARKLYIAGDLDESEWRNEKARVTQHLDALRPVAAPDMAQAAQLLGSIGSLWQHANDAEKLNLAKSLLEKVWIRRRVIVALEPRAAFYPLFEMLEQNETPSETSNGVTKSQTGATGVGRSSAVPSSDSTSRSTSKSFVTNQVIIILPPGVNVPRANLS